MEKWCYVPSPCKLSLQKNIKGNYKDEIHIMLKDQFFSQKFILKIDFFAQKFKQILLMIDPKMYQMFEISCQKCQKSRICPPKKIFTRENSNILIFLLLKIVKKFKLTFLDVIYTIWIFRQKMDFWHTVRGLEKTAFCFFFFFPLLV